MNNVITNIANIGTTIGDGLSGLLTGIKEFFTSLFLPDTDVLKTKIDEIKSYFAFVDDIKDIFDNLVDNVGQNSSAPKIEITVKNTKRNINKKVTFLDLSWYDEYKPVGDKLILAFCYGAFIINIYRRLPEIISGSGSMAINDAQIKSGKTIRHK